jgi:hypothetical protein
VISVELDPVAEVENERCGDAQNKHDENNDCESAHPHELPGARSSEPKAHPDRRALPALSLVDAEMSGDGMDVQEPEDEQRHGNQAHEGQRRDQERREAVEAVSPLPVAAPPRLFEHRKRLGRHRAPIIWRPSLLSYH